MDPEPPVPRLSEADLLIRLNYFSRQCWHQRRLYDNQCTALRQRIADQDALLKDAHSRLQDAHSRLQEVTIRLGQTFTQLQDVTAARIMAELKLACYGLLDIEPAADVTNHVRLSFIISFRSSRD